MCAFVIKTKEFWGIFIGLIVFCKITRLLSLWVPLAFFIVLWESIGIPRFVTDYDGCFLSKWHMYALYDVSLFIMNILCNSHFTHFFQDFSFTFYSIENAILRCWCTYNVWLVLCGLQVHYQYIFHKFFQKFKYLIDF